MVSSYQIPVKPKIDHSITELVLFSDVDCTFLLNGEKVHSPQWMALKAVL
jgi:hypothetical protein